MNRILEEFTKSVISEITRFEKQTGKKHSLIKEFDDLVTLGRGVSDYAFSMTELPKLGINPKTNHSTPAGVYFYPLNEICLHQLKTNTLPFASQAPYVNLVKLNISDKSRWLILGEGGGDKTEKHFVNMVNLLVSLNQEYKSANGLGQTLLTRFNTIASIEKRMYSTMEYFISGFPYENSNMRKRTILWRSIMLKLGIEGVYDNNTGSVFSEEPSQIACFKPSCYQLIGTYKTEELRKKNDINDQDKKNFNIASKFEKNKASEKEIDDAFNSHNTWQISEILKNPNTPEDVIDKIVFSSKSSAHQLNFNVREYSKNPNPSQNVSNKLIRQKHDLYLSYIFPRDSALLSGFGVIDDFRTLTSRKIQKICKEEILKFAKDDAFNSTWCPKILTCKITNPEIIEGMWKIFAKEQTPKLMKAYVGMSLNNYNTPEGVLTYILSDDFLGSDAKEESYIFLDNPNLPESFIRSEYDIKSLPKTRKIASNKNAPIDILENICEKIFSAYDSDSRNVLFRYDVVINPICGNPRLPQHLLEKIYNMAKEIAGSAAGTLYHESEAKKWMYEIAKNPSLPRSIIEEIIRDKSKKSISLKDAIIENPSLTGEDIVNLLIKRKSSFYRLIDHPNMPKKVLRKFLSSHLFDLDTQGREVAKNRIKAAQRANNAILYLNQK
jgi:hypothetical protein